MNKKNSEIIQDLANMRAKMQVVHVELDAITSEHNACIKQLKSTQEQLDHTENLYEAERVFHQKVTDALGDERAAHAKTRARLENITGGTMIVNVNSKRLVVESADGEIVFERDVSIDGEWDFQPLPSAVKFAGVPAVEMPKSLSDIKMDLIRKIIEE